MPETKPPERRGRRSACLAMARMLEFSTGPAGERGLGATTARPVAGSATVLCNDLTYRSVFPESRRGFEMTDYDRQTALIVVDVQNDFADPKGSLYVVGGEEILPVVNREIERALEAGAPVFYTQDWHPPSTPHFEKDGGTWPVHCVRGTWGAEFPPELKIVGEAVRKGSSGEDGYSGFTVRDPASGQESQTSLETMLRDRGVKRVVVVGLATDYCVKATALDAIDKGFQTTVLQDAVRAVSLQPGDGRRAMEEVVHAGGRVK
jgi:nicotinamidase/pyrazinamidase